MNRDKGAPGRRTAWGEHHLLMAEAPNICGDHRLGCHEGPGLHGKAFGLCPVAAGNPAEFLSRKELL